MNFKADWVTHLHQFRRRELSMVFNEFDGKIFKSGLELGAGDGFQSKLLVQHIKSLISTDLNEDRLPKESDYPDIQYRVMDAEMIGESFDKESFDIVYSSNLMEHLPKVENCFLGIHKVLKDDGVAIHIMPSPGWRFFSTVLHIPNKIANFLSKMTSNKKSTTSKQKGNNLKVDRNKNRWVDHFIPKPHGISPNSFIEFFAFRKSYWLKKFEETGFDVIDVKKGPVSSGYGFGMDRVRKMLETCGVATEYIYYTKKKQNASDI
jgi:SAM-dependent methyltransferase